MQHLTTILSGQGGLTGVQHLLSGATMRCTLRHTLSTLLEHPAQLGDCRLRRAKFKPGRKLTAYYDLQVRPLAGPGTIIRPLAVTWTVPTRDPQPEEQAVHNGAIEPGMATPFQRLFTTVPDWGMTLQVSPLDPRYPQLARLADPAYVGSLLADSTTAAKRAWPSAAGDYAITSIRYRPGQRHVLRYDPISPTPRSSEEDIGPGTLFAKLYADASQAQLSTLVNQVADWLSIHTPAVTALRPLVYLPADQVLLYPWAPGAPLTHGLKRPGRSLAGQLWQVGAALRALHQAPPTLSQNLPAHDFASERKTTVRTCEHISQLLPAAGQMIDHLLTRLQEEYSALPQEAPTLIHGDFKADHVLVAGHQLTLIDFDSCALADPAYDIGKFLADLAWWYHTNQQPGLRQAQNAFLAGYNLALTHPRLQRAHHWATLIGVKMTAHRVPIFARDWAERTAALIQRAWH